MGIDHSQRAKKLTTKKTGVGMSIDLRDKNAPLHVCVCGSMLWKVQAMFEDGEISLYMLDMECALCGALATAPTPVD